MARWRRGLHGRASGVGTVLPRYRPSRAASTIAALFAVGLVAGFTVAETADHSVVPHASVIRGATAPHPAHNLVVSPPPTTSITSVPVAPVVPPPSVTSRVVSPAAPAPCTPGNLSITTVTATSSYQPGVVIDITTELEASSSPCQLTPVESGAYSCGASVIVDGPSGSQVWPMADQGEQCAQPAAGVLQPGYGQNVTVAWNEQYVDPSAGSVAQAPPGQYQAFGTWTWSAGSGQTPYTVTAASFPFDIE